MQIDSRAMFVLWRASTACDWRGNASQVLLQGRPVFIAKQASQPYALSVAVVFSMLMMDRAA